MMEQWQAAEDRNILEAWSNGGRYQGKKVTDKRILAYYRKRRDSYDKDDPEYTEWDNELWQLRFQVSNEKVMMQYKLGKVGPMAVARHLQAWARRMPKNSSYYRSLMASSGDFIKAAQAGSSSGGGGGAFDYAAMQAKINAEDRTIAAGDRLIFAIDKYARQHNMIDGEQSVLDPEALNFWDSEMMDAILDGVIETDAWKAVVHSVSRVFPGFDAKAPTYERVRAMVEQQNRASRNKIRIWKQAPSDYTYYINAEREAIAGRKNSLLYLHGIDLKAKVAVLWDTWTGESSEGDGQNLIEGRGGATNPAEFLDGDPAMLQNARHYLKKFTDLGMDEEAAAVQMMIWVGEAGSSDEEVAQNALENLRRSDTTTIMFGPAFASQGGALLWGQNNYQQRNMLDAAIAGDAVIVPNAKNRETAMLSSFGENTGPNYQMQVLDLDPTTGLPRVGSDQQLIISRQLGKADNYADVGYLYEGKPVVDFNGATAGYVWYPDGPSRPFYGVYEGGSLRKTWVNPWQAAGAGLKAEGEGFVIDYGEGVTPKDPFAPDLTTLDEAITGVIGPLTEIDEETRTVAEGIADVLPSGVEAIMTDLELRDDAAAILDKQEPGWRQRFGFNTADAEAYLREKVAGWESGQPEVVTPLTMDLVTQNDPATAYASRQEQIAQAVSSLASSGLAYDSANVAYYAGNLEAAQNRVGNGWEGVMRVDALNNTSGPAGLQAYARDYGDFWTAGRVMPVAQRLINDGATPEVIEAGTFVGWEEARLQQQEKAGQAFAEATGFDAANYRPGSEVTWPGIFSMAMTPAERSTGADRVQQLFRSEQLLPMAPSLARKTGEVAQPDLKVAANLSPLTGTKSNIAQNINVRMPNISGIQTPTIRPIDVEPIRVNVGIPNTTRPPLSGLPPATPVANRPVMDEEGRTALGGGR